MAELDWAGAALQNALAASEEHYGCHSLPRPRRAPLLFVIDSTGLQALGKGEWKVRKHGADKCQAWRKLHLVINVDGHQVRAEEMTDHRYGNGEIVLSLLAQLGREDARAGLTRIIAAVDVSSNDAIDAVVLLWSGYAFLHEATVLTRRA